jgi:hypothetical protein
LSKVLRIDDKVLRMSKEIFAPVSTDPIHVWARKNIVLTRAFATPGPFRVESSRYLIEPFDAIKDIKTRLVICSAAVQTGKSLLIDISIPWIIANKPGPIQFSQATDPMISDHLKNRLYPLFQNCVPLKNIIPTTDKDFTNSGIRFPSCTLYCNGEKESAFQAKSIQYAFCDEVWLWTRGRLPEAIARVSAFDVKGTSKVVVVSQPGTTEDDFYKIYEQGTQEEWCVPCSNPECGEYFFPAWRGQHEEDGTYFGMLWNTDDITKPSGSYDMPELVKTIRYECEKCGFKHIDSKQLKYTWNKHGKYISRNAKATNKTRSFRWNSVISRDWDLLVEEFLQAKELSDKGIHTNLKSFFQKRIAQPYDPNYYQFVGNLKTDIYDTSIDWAEGIVKFATIDVQKMSFWMIIREHSATGSSRQLYAGNVETLEDLKKILLNYKVNSNCVFVDIGNSEKQENSNRHLVYEMVDENHWTGLRGDHWADNKGGYEWTIKNQMVKLFYSKPQTLTNSVNRRWYYNFAPSHISDILKELRDGKSHEYKCLDNAEYKRQMFAEKKIPIRDKYNQVVWRWKNINNNPNHLWDCEKMQVVAACIHPSVHIIPKL